MSDLPISPESIAAQVVRAAAGGAEQGFKATAGDVWGGLIGDRVRQWRQRNLISSLERTAHFLKRKGINLADARPLDDGELYAMFEGSSKASSPQLRDLWASLLAAHLDPTLKSVPNANLYAVLQQMSETDAVLLDFIYVWYPKLETFNKNNRRERSEISGLQRFVLDLTGSDREEEITKRRARLQNTADQFLADIQNELRIRLLNDEGDLNLARRNLFRLGLITPRRSDPPAVRANLIGSRGISRQQTSSELVRVIEELESKLLELEEWALVEIAVEDRSVGIFSKKLIVMNYSLTPLAEQLLQGMSEAN